MHKIYSKKKLDVSQKPSDVSLHVKLRCPSGTLQTPLAPGEAPYFSGEAPSFLLYILCNTRKPL